MQRLAELGDRQEGRKRMREEFFFWGGGVERGVLISFF